jgi:Mlc titration factor MtfA (ptsG expression regulator)
MRIFNPSTLVFQGLMALITGVCLAVVGARLMPGGAWLGGVLLLVVGAWALRRPWRRWGAARAPMPEAWRRWLEAHIPLYARLDEGARERFDRDVRFYLADQTFEGVDGLDVTDELRLGVAGGVALLLHGRPAWEISTARTVLFYPGRFDEDYYETYAASFDGMVHAQGPMILAADAVEQGWAEPYDGSNVVLHELAHLFDFEGSSANGAPSLMGRASAQAWQELVEHEMRRIRQGRSLLRRYAATNAAEFFAVSVEVFFERPDALYASHRRLFEALVSFFNQDPRDPGRRPEAS